MLSQQTDSQVYDAYGVRFRSRLVDLPAHRVDCDDAPVTLSPGHVPQVLPDAVHTPHFSATRECLWCGAPGVGRYLVESGTRITIEADPSASAAAVYNMLFGMAFGALLIQRGRFALHGSSVATPRGAVIFCGDGGSGKSTLAALLAEAGLAVVADDVSALRADEQGWHVARGTTVAKLTDATQGWLRAAQPGPRFRALHQEKTVVSLGDRQVIAPWTPVWAVCLLDRGAPQFWTPLASLEAVAGLERHVYKRAAVGPLGQRATYFAAAARLAGQVPVGILGGAADCGAVDWAGRVAGWLTTADPGVPLTR